MAVERSSLPAWGFYAILWLLPLAVVAVVLWLTGVRSRPGLPPFHATLWGTGVLALALTHYLNRTAERSLAAFAPALEVDDEELASLRYRLTTLPAGKALLALAAGVLVAAAEMATLPAETVAGLGLFTSPAATAIELGMYVLGWAFFATLVYHTVHQLKVVDYIHRHCTSVNLFRLGPTYGFSWLTARTALGIALIPYLYFLAATSLDPNSAQPQWAYVVVANFAAALLLFAWPLLGMHRILEREKARLLREASIRLENAVAELHDRADAKDYGVMDGINKLISSLVLERDALERISTWPWKPETPRLLVTALLLPLAVYLGQRALAGVLG